MSSLSVWALVIAQGYLPGILDGGIGRGLSCESWPFTEYLWPGANINGSLTTDHLTRHLKPYSELRGHRGRDGRVRRAPRHARTVRQARHRVRHRREVYR